MPNASNGKLFPDRYSGIHENRRAGETDVRRSRDTETRGLRLNHAPATFKLKLIKHVTPRCANLFSTGALIRRLTRLEY